MAAIGFSFPTIDARSSPIFQISGENRRPSPLQSVPVLLPHAPPRPKVKPLLDRGFAVKCNMAARLSAR